MNRQYDDEGHGVLFINDKKQNERQPDYKGNITVNGVKHELAAWLKISKAGNQFLSISLGNPIQARGETRTYGGAQATPAPVTPASAVPEDDEIPF